jgi:transposase
VSQAKRPLTISREEFHVLYEQGEDALYAIFTELLSTLNQFETRISELEGRLSKTSRNSSKPPSGDGFGKRTRSLRSKSEKPSGGQPEHPGSTLEWREKPDSVLEYPVHKCQGCGQSLTSVPVKGQNCRQVFDLPEIELFVTEHRADEKTCPHCGVHNQGEIPAEAKTLVQYGPRLKARMVYLMEGQLLPAQRSCEVMKDLMGAPISEGTLFTTREQCFEALAPLDAEIHAALIQTEVLQGDETGIRVKGQLSWLHVACTSGLTYYFIHAKRGQTALDEMGIWPKFKGKAVHDGFKSYSSYACQHFLCNAHHLRELQFLVERYQQAWAYQMIVLLVTSLTLVQAAQADGKSVLDSEQLGALTARYEAILAQGLAANPRAEHPNEQPKPRGRPKQTPARNLLERLREQQSAVLGFLHDFAVPFDNNLAERDLRMVKLKQKISGGFRSTSGAKMFCRIRGAISTWRKQNHPLLQSLVDLFSGKIPTLRLQPE